MTRQVDMYRSILQIGTLTQPCNLHDTCGNINRDRVILGVACETSGADPEFYKGARRGVARVPWGCKIKEACSQNVKFENWNLTENRFTRDSSNASKQKLQRGTCSQRFHYCHNIHKPFKFLSASPNVAKSCLPPPPYLNPLWLRRRYSSSPPKAFNFKCNHTFRICSRISN